MNNKTQIILYLLFLLFLLTRLIPYLNNPVPTGYDAGLYLYIFKTFPHLANWLKIGFSPGLFVSVFPFLKLGADPQKILIPISILSQVFLFASIYIVSLKLFGKKVSLFIAFIFVVSCIQYRTYWYFYVKNSFGLGFMLFSLYFLGKGKLIPALVFSLLVGFFHLPTFLILFLVIASEILLNPKKRAFYLSILVIILSLIAVYYLPQLKQTVLPYFPLLLKSLFPVRIFTGTASFGGAFYGIAVFLLLVILYLPLSVYGIYLAFKNKKTDIRPFITGLIVTFILVVTKFSFYQRFLIPLDIFLIFFAGIGLDRLFEKYGRNYSEVIRFYSIILIIFAIGFIWKTSSPLIDRALYGEINEFGRTVKSGYVLTLSADEPAWLMGYTDNKIIAREFGGFDRYWNKKQWDEFEGGLPTDRIKLLKLLPRPLYIFINDSKIVRYKDLFTAPCYKNQSLHFVKVEC